MHKKIFNLLTQGVTIIDLKLFIGKYANISLCKRIINQESRWSSKILIKRVTKEHKTKWSVEYELVLKRRGNKLRGVSNVIYLVFSNNCCIHVKRIISSRKRRVMILHHLYATVSIYIDKAWLVPDLLTGRGLGGETLKLQK